MEITVDKAMWEPAGGWQRELEKANKRIAELEKELWQHREDKVLKAVMAENQRLEARQDQLIRFVSELKLTDKQIDRFCELTKVNKAALLGGE